MAEFDQPEPLDRDSPPPPPPKEGMSTGVKIAIGCGILVVIVIILLVIAALAGGLFLKDKADEISGGLEAQQAAGESIRQLEEEHPFTPPEDGVIGGDRAATFFEVTDDAWEQMADEMGDLSERARNMEEGEDAGFGDAMAGMRGLGQARVALADALVDNEMPVSEYLWTGLMLVRAYENLDRAAEETNIPEENLALAADHRDELVEIAEDEGDDQEPDKSMVLGMAWTWGVGEGAVQDAMGWDTLGQYAP